MKPPSSFLWAFLLRAGRFLALAGVLLLFARAGLLLAREPCLGVADNLDYWRVARPAGIEVAPQKRQGAYVVCSYPAGESRLAGGFSSPALAAWLARRLDWGLGVPAGVFDLRQAGLLYGLAAAVLLLGALLRGLSPFLALLFAWVVADPGFLLFFNSLYADPALIVALLGVAALVPLAGEGRVLLVLLAGLAAAASFSKMQFAPFALVLAAAYGVALLARRRRPAAAQAWFLAALVLAGLAASWHFLRGSGPRFLDANNYNAVYGGIARVASDPGDTLGFLGIPPEHRSRPTRDYFAAGVGEADPAVRSLRSLSRLRLAGAYLRDPGAVSRAATAAEGVFRKVKAHPRGTYTRAEARGRRGVYQEPGQYSLWRARLLGFLPSRFPWVVLGAVLTVLGVRAFRGVWGPFHTLLLFLALWVAGQVAVALLGEGFVNLHQHLLGARLGFDLLLVTLLFLAFQAAARRLTA